MENDVNARLRTVKKRERLLWIVVVLLLFGNAAAALVFFQNKTVHGLSVVWLLSGEIRFFSFSDGPFVVTHLVVEGGAASDKAVACLPQPVAIVDSHGATLERVEVARLKWVNIYGLPVARPVVGAKIHALYVRPEVTVERTLP